jgi:hypothetical protein
METAFEITSHGVLVSGTVIHGRVINGYGGAPPEVLFDRVKDEDAGETWDFERWLDAHPKKGRERIRMVEEMEEEAIAKVVMPRDREDELACRGDAERDAAKDGGR